MYKHINHPNETVMIILQMNYNVQHLNFNFQNTKFLRNIFDRPCYIWKMLQWHQLSTRFGPKTKRIATFFKVNSNRRPFSFPLSAVCLHNGSYLATICARACSIIDFASFHGQEAASAENGEGQERAAFHVGIVAMFADDGRLFEFLFSSTEKRSCVRSSSCPLPCPFFALISQPIDRHFVLARPNPNLNYQIRI